MGAVSPDLVGPSSVVSERAVSVVPALELREGDWILVEMADGTQEPCRLRAVYWSPLDPSMGPVTMVSSDALRWRADERVRRLQAPELRA